MWLLGHASHKRLSGSRSDSVKDIIEMVSFFFVALGLAVLVAQLTPGIQGPGILTFGMIYLLGFIVEHFAKKADAS